MWREGGGRVLEPGGHCILPKIKRREDLLSILFSRNVTRLQIGKSGWEGTEGRDSLSIFMVYSLSNGASSETSSPPHYSPHGFSPLRLLVSSLPHSPQALHSLLQAQVPLFAVLYLGYRVSAAVFSDPFAKEMEALLVSFHRAVKFWTFFFVCFQHSIWRRLRSGAKWASRFKRDRWFNCIAPTVSIAWRALVCYFFMVSLGCSNMKRGLELVDRTILLFFYLLLSCRNSWFIAVELFLYALSAGRIIRWEQ